MAYEGHKPQRTCLGCRQVRDQQDLLRYVLSPAGEMLVDYRGRLPGRGAYTCLNLECLRTAVQRRQFQRVFKSPNLAIEVDRLTRELLGAIETKIVNLLGMAKKSGMTMSGGRLVLDALAVPGQLAVVMLADDVSAGIGDKLAGSAAARGIPCWRLLDKERLGRMLGKGERSVVALKSGALAESVKAEMLRYKQIAGEI
jgi:predicted RNA-binding protein YlxR (DUF448 family)